MSACEERETRASAGAPPAQAVFLLVRVDDRLLHGQVVHGWAAQLAPRRYLIADDRVAADGWETEAFAAAADGVALEAWDLARFAREWRACPDPRGTIVLLRDLAALRALVAGGFRPHGEINLGGAHGGSAARALLPFLQLTPAELGILKDLLRGACPLYAQELPGTPRYGAAALRAAVESAGGAGPGSATE